MAQAALAGGSGGCGWGAGRGGLLSLAVVLSGTVQEDFLCDVGSNGFRLRVS